MISLAGQGGGLLRRGVPTTSTYKVFCQRSHAAVSQSHVQHAQKLAKRLSPLARDSNPCSSFLPNNKNEMAVRSSDN
jgi:hypothetical protein